MSKSRPGLHHPHFLQPIDGFQEFSSAIERFSYRLPRCGIVANDSLLCSFFHLTRSRVLHIQTYFRSARRHHKVLGRSRLARKMLWRARSPEIRNEARHTRRRTRSLRSVISSRCNNYSQPGFPTQSSVPGDSKLLLKTKTLGAKDGPSGLAPNL